MALRKISSRLMATVNSVHTNLRLHKTPEKFFIEPYLSGSNEVVVIDRRTSQLRLESPGSLIPSTADIQEVLGIFGVVRLVAGPYLMVITRHEKVGEVSGHSIFRALEIDILPYVNSLNHLSQDKQLDNRAYLSLIESQIKADPLQFYYSYTFDLTHTLERVVSASSDFHSLPLHERADERFVWNKHLLTEFTQQRELARYCLPVMHGFVGIHTATINSKPFLFGLISRRSSYRAGTRYYMRGVDLQGHAANFIETEQIVQGRGQLMSYVQTRGSIPLGWSQYPDLRYKPPPQMWLDRNSQVQALRRHFEDQTLRYGRQVGVNLVNQNGSESLVGKQFAELVASVGLPGVKIEWFDFHHICGATRWHRLQELVDRLSPDQDDFGYFHLLKDGSVERRQTGVFRTNCMDCLDRTNVCQSVFALRILNEQLQRLGILDPDMDVRSYEGFYQIFRAVWADNGDACSIQYAGTPAQKGDYTRLGKRSLAGPLMDGYKGLARYVKNNFFDGQRQDAIDLMLGNYTVDEELQDSITTGNRIGYSPIRSPKSWRYVVLPMVLLSASAMFTISLILPAEDSTWQAVVLMFWATAWLITMMLILSHGKEFVDRPKLAWPKHKVD